jgi:hypothetical protein
MMTPRQRVALSVAGRVERDRKMTNARVIACCANVPQHGFALALVRKVASSSMRAEVLRLYGLEPERPTSEGVYAMKVPQIAPLDAHKQGLLVAAFVRNPFDRLVSVWKNKVYEPAFEHVRPHILSIGFSAGMGFTDFIARVRECRDLDLHLAPQSAYLGPGFESYGFLGRYEKLAADWSRLRARRPVLRPLPKVNVTEERKSYRHYYDRHTRREAETVYADDLERFNYSF